MFLNTENTSKAVGSREMRLWEYYVVFEVNCDELMYNLQGPLRMISLHKPDIM